MSAPHASRWALGRAARSRALTTVGPAAEEHYRVAIEGLGRSRMAAYLARTHLVYGEWLCREGRRMAARQQPPYRPRHAVGHGPGRVRRTRGPGAARHGRAPQELQIARLVATGATSREVGAQLSLSPRTVEAYLRSIFRKLDINSRRQLQDLTLP